MPVEIVIANPHPHARLFFSIVTESYPPQYSFFAECSVMVVHEKQAGSGIAGDVNIRPSVFIQIRCHHGHAIAWRSLRDTCLLADVGKRPVAVVSVEQMASHGKPARATLHGNAFEIAIRASSRNRRMFK